MKITLDHNCIIHLEKKTDIGLHIKTIVENPTYECFVVNIGASEWRDIGVKPDAYHHFVKLLETSQIEHLVRLNPMLIWDVVFWDYFILPDETMIELAKKIEQVLFGKSPPIDISKIDIDSSDGRKWINRICDVQSLWCHIQNSNDVFLTVDRNFVKASKLPTLIGLGAKMICHPLDLHTSKNMKHTATIDE